MECGSRGEHIVHKNGAMFGFVHGAEPPVVPSERILQVVLAGRAPKSGLRACGAYAPQAWQNGQP